MSPRRNRPQREVSDVRPPRPETDISEGGWAARQITGDAATKTYRCPGCMQDIRPGVAHVVAWPADELGDATDRRHWHNGCWRARDRRGPVVERSRNAPRHG